MDLRKFACPDQCFPRRKVVSGVGLGLFASFFILSVVFMNVSFKASLLNPVLEGFNAYFSKGTAIYCDNSTSVCSNGSSSSSLSSRLDHFMVLNGTLYSNVSKNGESVEVSGSGPKGQILEAENGTLYGNVSKDGESLQFPDSVGKGQNLGDENRNSNVSKNGGSLDFPDSGTKGQVLGDVNGTVYKNVSSNGESDSGSKGQILGDENGDSEEIHVEIGDFNVSSVKNVSEDIGSSGFHGDCDIYDGRWVRDESKPFYPPGSCPHIDRDFDCFLNKRPDDEYVKWRWQPNHCDIPSLNATDFLERLRGQKLVFVGDSLNRNMWESLVCILRQSIPDKKRVYEISGRREFKKKGFYAFRFEDYNCTVDFVSSPFLVRESSFNGTNGSFDTLRLDLMDKTTLMYHDADVLIFNTGHWWTHEKTSKGEDYYQEGDHVHKTLKVLDAYNRALGTWATWVDNNIDHEKTQVIFRGYSETHFRGGPWNSGGQCHKETEPFLNETHLAKYPSKMRALERVINEMKYPLVYMNISRLTDYRKDGHPSIYRKEYKTEEEKLAGVHSQDCSHWCLPGVPDTWNELLYASLLKTGRGSWRL